MSETDISPEVMRAFIEADYCAALDGYVRGDDPRFLIELKAIKDALRAKRAP